MEKSQIINIIEFMVPFLFEYSRIIILSAIVFSIQFFIAESRKKENSWFSAINRIGSPYKYLSFPIITYLFALAGCSCIGFWIILSHLTGSELKPLMLSAIVLQFLSLTSLLCGIGYATYSFVRKDVNNNLGKPKEF